jgi:hypothetical protein
LATKANILIDQGTDYLNILNLTNDDDEVLSLVGYTGTAQIRKHYTSSVSYPFTVTIAEQAGEVSLAMTAEQTASLAAGRYVYDCELRSSGGLISRILEGIVTVTPQVTR